MKRIVFVFTLVVALTAGSIAAQQQAEPEQAREEGAESFLRRHATRPLQGRGTCACEGTRSEEP